MIGTDMVEELRLYAGLPLFAFVVLLSSAGLFVLILASYCIYIKARGRFAICTFFKDAFGKLHWLLCLMAVTDLFLVSNNLLVRGLGVGIWDVDGQYYPYQVLVADYARTGSLVSWDLWSNAGRPMLGDPQVGALSPLNTTIGLITGGTSSGFVFYWLLMWWMGGFGILSLSRHLDVPPWGACVVALGFLFCGAYTGHAEHTSIITAFSFLPLIVWRLDVGLLSRKLQPAIEAGALWGLSALAGYPALTIITGCFLVLWTMGRWLFTPYFHGQSMADKVASQTALVVMSFALLLVLSVGLMVLSPTYIAFFFEGTGVNARVGSLNRDRAIISNALHPDALSTFSSPSLAMLKLEDQMSGKNGLWPYTDVSYVSIYIGAIIPVLSVYALLREPRNRWRWWLMFLGILSLACALGQTLPLRGWLYDWFYPMRFFRHAAIFRLYYLFSVSVLALLATRDLDIAIRHSDDRARRQFLAVSLFIASAALFVFLRFTNPPFVPKMIILILGSFHALWAWLGICCAALIAWKLSSRRWALPAMLIIIGSGDAFLTSTLSKQIMVSTKPEDVKRWAILDEKHSPVLDITGNRLIREESPCVTDPGCLKNDQMITKVPVLNSYATGENYFHQQMVGHTILKQMALGPERVWFSKLVGHIAPTKLNFLSFIEKTDILGAPPLVVHTENDLIRVGAPPPEELLRGEESIPPPEEDAYDTNTNQIGLIERLPPAEKISVNVVKYTPNELVFNVQCSADGWLLVTDRWARSWRAEVNGSQTTLYGGNFIFRAVQVSAGQNNIRFTYRPFGFPWLVLMSWGTLAGVGCYSLYSAFHRRKGFSVAGELRRL